MRAPKRSSWLMAIIERLCFGAVPVDGMYWFERTPAPKPQPNEPEHAPDLAAVSAGTEGVASTPAHNRKHAA